MSKVKDWMSEEEAAAWLSVPIEAVRDAVRKRKLPVLELEGYIRINRDALLALVNSSLPNQPTAEPTVAPELQTPRGGIPTPARLSWLEEIRDAAAFEFRWPARRGVISEEPYPQAWEASISLVDEQVRVRIGECVRHNRGRLTVFFDRWPICEFVATVAGEGWASVIKPDGKKVLRPGEAPPPLYRDTRIEPYREAVGWAGSGVPKGLAVVIPRTDLRSAVHHAAARWLGRRRFAVEASAQYHA